MSPYFVSFLGLIGVIVVAWLYLQRRKVLAEGIRVTGTVVDVVRVKRQNEIAHTNWRLIIEFSDQAGATHRIERYRTAQIRRLGWDKGSSVELVYPIGKPDSVTYVSGAASGGYLWGLVLALALLIIPLLDTWI